MSQKRILLVDDDPEMRLALAIRLTYNHYDVGTAIDGDTALAEACGQPPDVILLDLGLPNGDGFTVIDRLQQTPALAHIPIIVVSGRDRLASRDRAIKAGAKLFLQKPVRNLDLLDAIVQVLTSTGVPVAVAPTPVLHSAVPPAPAAAL